MHYWYLHLFLMTDMLHALENILIYYQSVDNYNTIIDQ